MITADEMRLLCRQHQRPCALLSSITRDHFSDTHVRPVRIRDLNQTLGESSRRGRLVHGPDTVASERVGPWSRRDAHDLAVGRAIVIPITGFRPAVSELWPPTEYPSTSAGIRA